MHLLSTALPTHGHKAGRNTRGQAAECFGWPRAERVPGACNCVTITKRRAAAHVARHCLVTLAKLAQTMTQSRLVSPLAVSSSFATSLHVGFTSKRLPVAGFNLHSYRTVQEHVLKNMYIQPVRTATSLPSCLPPHLACSSYLRAKCTNPLFKTSDKAPGLQSDRSFLKQCMSARAGASDLATAVEGELESFTDASDSEAGEGSEVDGGSAKPPVK